MNKLLFVDIDGTITHDDGSISKSTKRVLKKYKNVILTTGRARKDVKWLCDELNLRYFISSYGSEVYDNYENKIIFSITFKPNIVAQISHLALKNNLTMTVAIDDKDILITKDNYLSVTYNVKQCMIKGTINNLNNMRKSLTKIKGIKYQRDNAYEHGCYWFGIRPEEVNKGVAAKYMLEYLKVDNKSAVALGNDINDLPLFMIAKEKVAVSNSCEELKRAATIIIGDNNTDSVKKYIESIIS